jgi:7-cyano-7-deazaguanine synthase
MIELDNSKALVLLSGGQDSTTCLAWAIEKFQYIETIGYTYGQRHRVEIDCRQDILAFFKASPRWGGKIGQDHLVDIPALTAIGATAMTSEAQIFIDQSGLPTTFVPGRNLVFLTFAAAVAYRRSCKNIVTGVCETDYSGYPDCRDDTIKALQVAVNAGLESRFTFHTPLMWIDKAETWALAHQIGGQEFTNLIIQKTHTCYLGNRERFHSWGYGCGECPACDLRSQGWAKWDGNIPH